MKKNEKLFNEFLATQPVVMNKEGRNAGAKHLFEWCRRTGRDMLQIGQEEIQVFFETFVRSGRTIRTAGFAFPSIQRFYYWAHGRGLYPEPDLRMPELKEWFNMSRRDHPEQWTAGHADDDRMICKVIRTAHERILGSTPGVFTREWAEKIDWDEPAIVITGEKGTGKSTILRQHIRTAYRKGDTSVLYCSADSPMVCGLGIVRIARALASTGGRTLCIDEAQNISTWLSDMEDVRRELPSLHLVICGDFMMAGGCRMEDIRKRGALHVIPGLSFREFMMARTGTAMDAIALDDLVSDPRRHVLPIACEHDMDTFFYEYLKEGYYAYTLDRRQSTEESVMDDVMTVTGEEIPTILGTKYSTVGMLRQLLLAICRGVRTPQNHQFGHVQNRPKTLTLKSHVAGLLSSGLVRIVPGREGRGGIEGFLFPSSATLAYCLDFDNHNMSSMISAFMAGQLDNAGYGIRCLGNDGEILAVRLPGKRRRETYLLAGVREVKVFTKLDRTSIEKAVRVPLWAFGFLY